MSQDQKTLKKLEGSNELASAQLSKRELQDKLEEYVSLVGILKLHLETAEKEISERDEKIRHLENILTKQTPLIGGGSIELDEVTIAKMQLQKLGTAAVQRELTAEEARKFEIYSRVIQNSEKKQAAPPSPLKDVSPARLIEIARQKPKALEGSDE